MSNCIINYLAGNTGFGMEKEAAGIVRGLGRIGRKYFPTFTRLARNVKENAGLYGATALAGGYLMFPGLAAGYGAYKNRPSARRNSANPYVSAEAWKQYDIEHGMDPDEAEYHAAARIERSPDALKYGTSDDHWKAVMQRADAQDRLTAPYRRTDSPMPAYLNARSHRR